MGRVGARFTSLLAGVQQTQHAAVGVGKFLPAGRNGRDVGRVPLRERSDRRGEDRVEQPRAAGSWVAGENDPRRALAQKKVLQRSYLLQDRLLQRPRQFAHEALQLFKNVEER